MTRECSCGRPTDLFGCEVCGEALGKLLAGVPALVVELDTTIARLGRSAPGAGKSSETPLVFNPKASETLAHLRSVVKTWAAHVAVHQGIPLVLTPAAKAEQRWSGRAVIPAPAVVDQATLAARWLLTNFKLVRRIEAWPNLYATITDAVWAARRAIDRPADKTFAGPCDGVGSVHVTDVDPCGYDLLADPEWTTIRCGCGHEYDVALRRQWMLDDLRYRLGSSRWVSRTVTALAAKVSESTVRVWAMRRKLQPRDWLSSVKEGGQPRPQYLVNDVLIVATGGTVDYTDAYGYATITRWVDGTRTVEHADPLIRVEAALLACDDDLAPDVVDPDGTLRLDTAGEYRYRHVYTENQNTHVYQRITDKIDQPTQEAS
jgi:hypothetical protein